MKSPYNGEDNTPTRMPPNKTSSAKNGLYLC